MSNEGPQSLQNNPYKTQQRSPHFETVFANAFALRFAENDCTLYTLITDQPGKLTEAEVQSAIIMTPRSAKTLATLLMDSLIDFEKRAGATLPLNHPRREKFYEAAKAAWEPLTDESAED